MTEGDPAVEVAVRELLGRQLDIAADRISADVLGPAVGGLHDSWSAARHYREASARELAADLASECVVGLIFAEARRPEHGDARADEMEGAKAAEKFEEDADGADELEAAGLWAVEELPDLGRGAVPPVVLSGSLNHRRSAEPRHAESVRDSCREAAPQVGQPGYSQVRCSRRRPSKVAAFVFVSRGTAIAIPCVRMPEMSAMHARITTLVRDVMTGRPITIDPEARLTDAMAMMRDKQIRHLPVVDDKRRVVGIITDRDLRSAAMAPPSSRASL